MTNVAQIHFLGPISIHTVESLRNMILKALHNGAQELQILMSSEGGDLLSGVTAYNYIRSLQVKTTMINMGSIESIAMIPFLAGDERIAVPNAKFLIHSFTYSFPNSPIDTNRVIERSHSLSFETERYAAIFEERTQGAHNPLHVKQHLTGAAIVMSNIEAFLAGILTVESPRFPEIPTDKNFFDTIFS